MKVYEQCIHNAQWFGLWDFNPKNSSDVIRLENLIELRHIQLIKKIVYNVEHFNPIKIQATISLLKSYIKMFKIMDESLIFINKTGFCDKNIFAIRYRLSLNIAEIKKYVKLLKNYSDAKVVKSLYFKRKATIISDYLYLNITNDDLEITKKFLEIEKLKIERENIYENWFE